MKIAFCRRHEQHRYAVVEGQYLRNFLVKLTEQKHTSRSGHLRHASFSKAQ